MSKKETFTSRFEETRGGRVPQKSEIWGDVFYGWSLTGCAIALPGLDNIFTPDIVPQIIACKNL